jgi:hypothetical protein
MRKLYVIALLLPFVFSCNSDGNGLYGPPDAFEWDFDLGVFNGDVDMYFGGVCVTGSNDDIFSYGDKRRGNTSWKC